jgi:hypothetical protein
MEGTGEIKFSGQTKTAAVVRTTGARGMGSLQKNPWSFCYGAMDEGNYLIV